MTFDVTVVVPTHGRAALLGCCLDALLAQNLEPGRFEIVVVDDGAEEGTREAVRRRTARSGPTLWYIPFATTRGPAAARNAGWRLAHAPIIAFTDDDCLPAPGWLRGGLASLADGATGASGRLVVPLSSVPSDYERNVALLEEAQFATANCFYRRDALAEIGGFDERFTAAWREDADVYLTLLERGARLVSAPEAEVVHPIRPAPWGISLRQQAKSQFNALLYRKHPALYRQRIQASPPLEYYRMVFCALVAAYALLTGRRALATRCTAQWFSLTALFCLRRLEGTKHTPSHITEMALTSALIPFLAMYWRLGGAVRFRVLFL